MMTIDNFLNAHPVDLKYLDYLSNMEKSLYKMFKTVEITGKKGRRVPVLFTNSYMNRLLLQMRSRTDVLNDNIYLFATNIRMSDLHEV